MSRKNQNGMACALLLVVLFGAQMIMHLNVDHLLLDDWVFYAVREEGMRIPAYLAQRWQTWSSRLFIEGLLCLLTHSIWTFRVLDSLIMVLMAWSMARLADGETRPQILALSSALVTTIPFAVLRSTGWMATSLNYYWPLACTFAALIPLTDALWKRKTARPLLVVCLLCAVLGANQEQTAAVLSGSYLVLGIVLWLRDRRISPALLIIFVIALLELAMHLLCPGNALRAEQSVSLVNLRDYGQFSMIDKLSIGLTSTTALLIYTYNPILLSCGAVVGATVTARRRGKVAHVLVLLPAVFVLRAFFAYFTYYSNGLAGVNRPFSSMYTYSLLLGPQGIGDGVRMVMLGITVCMLGLMALSLYLSIGHRPLAAGAVFAFAIGFAARMALSFSPTVVESGERTMLPLYGAVMLCALLCVRDCRGEGARRWPLFAAGAICLLLAAANLMGSFALAA